MKQTLINNLKNLPGARTKRKHVIFSVDDYGAVSLDSKQARDLLEKKSNIKQSHFHRYDALENKIDLEYLYGVLRSVKDKNQNHAIFTPFALPCNIDFEKLKKYDTFRNEPLFETYEKLSQRHPSSYEGTWELWKQGIREGLMQPQFHGREHLHVGIFNHWLQNKEPHLMRALECRSFAFTAPSPKKHHSVGAAFGFDNPEENEGFKEIIEDGLNRFEEVFGYRAIQFNAPAGVESQLIHGYLHENGIKSLDQPIVKHEHLGFGKHKKEFNYLGKRNKLKQVYVVRNVIFEPSKHPNKDNVGLALKQIEAAFRWNKPANISSHRVNYCGHINPENRKQSLAQLKDLLHRIVKKWPEAEFVSVPELVEEIGGR